MYFKKNMYTTQGPSIWDFCSELCIWVDIIYFCFVLLYFGLEHFFQCVVPWHRMTIEGVWNELTEETLRYDGTQMEKELPVTR